MRLRHSIWIVFLVSVLLASCSSPFVSVTENSDTGALTVSVSDGQLRPSTVFPSIDRESLVYRFELRNDAAGQELVHVVGERAHEFTDLVPGAWTVTVVAAFGPAEEASWDTPVLRGATPVQVRAGEQLQIVVVLQVPESGRGGLDFMISWPEEEPVVAVEYRLDTDGSSGDWERVPSTSFLTADGSTSVAVSIRDLVPGDYILTARLDAGESRDLRYRAHVEEVVHIVPGVVTEAGFALSGNEFSRVPIEPGTWEFFEQQGKIIINADGSIQFTDTGFRYAVGENLVSVDPESYAISFEGSGEKRLFGEMPDVSSIRVEVRGAFIDGTSGGWAILFHGTDPGGNRDYEGWSLQVDRGPGDRIVLRQWGRGREQPPVLEVTQDAHGIDWTQTLDLNVDIDGFALRAEVVQGSVSRVVVDVADVRDLDNVNRGQARDSGFIGLRSWAGAPVAIEEMRLILPE